MLKIRLQRIGKKKQADFRIVLAEKHKAVKKKAKEILGNYNPRTKDFEIKDEQRLKYWIDQNVELSPTVHNLLVSKGLIKDDKVQAWRPKVKSESEEGDSVSAKESETQSEQPKKEDNEEAPASAEESENKKGEDVEDKSAEKEDAAESKDEPKQEKNQNSEKDAEAEDDAKRHGKKEEESEPELEQENRDESGKDEKKGKAADEEESSEDGSDNEK